LGKAGVAPALAILKYMRRGITSLASSNNGPGRNAGDLVIGIEMILVPVIEKGLDRQPLEGGESRPIHSE
jgi:hypothetical protein